MATKGANDAKRDHGEVASVGWIIRVDERRELAEHVDGNRFGAVDLATFFCALALQPLHRRLDVGRAEIEVVSSMSMAEGDGREGEPHTGESARLKACRSASHGSDIRGDDGSRGRQAREPVAGGPTLKGGKLAHVGSRRRVADGAVAEVGGRVEIG